MTRQQDTFSSVAQLADELAHGTRALHIQAVGRFIQQHIGRIMDEGPGNCHLQLLAGGKTFGPPIGNGFHIEQIDQPVHLPFERLPIQVVQMSVVTDVLTCRQPWIQTLRIREHADVRLNVDGRGRHVEAIDTRRSAVGFEERVKHPQRCTLSRAVRSE